MRALPAVAFIVGLPTLAYGDAKTFGFDGDAIDAPPSRMSFGRTGPGKPGRWIVQAATNAPSGNKVLAQVDPDDTSSRFPIAVLDGVSAADVTLSVKCKAISGTVDRACGLVWRYRDENNYYIARANVLENNVRIYFVKNGKRKEIGSISQKVTADAWHELRVQATGDRFTVAWNSKVLLDVKDGTYPGAGKVGVWTKADSVTWFDDLTVDAAAPPEKHGQ